MNKVLVLSLALALGLVAGCTSKEEQLVSLKRDNRAALDNLYARYGGGALAAGLKQESARGIADVNRQGGEGKDTAVELLKMFGNAAGEVDRIAFEEQCFSLGRGERPAILNDKARVFFADRANIAACEKVGTRAVKIEALERELGEPARSY
jgi:hypothetical protein